jgi:hypothetical protein
MTRLEVNHLPGGSTCVERAAFAAWLALSLPLFMAGLLEVVTARGDEVQASSPERVGTRRALVICGLPGDDEHRTMYAAAVTKIIESLTGRCGFPASEVWVRFAADAAAEASFGPTTNRGPAERAGIEADVAELRRRLAPEDSLWVIVLGHGHYDGRHSHLNLPGPDPDEPRFARIFAGLDAREQVFFITTSASGFFLKPLAAPGRVVITATEPDREVNETLFPLALADVLAAPPPEADRDKDGALSLLELYLAVVTDVLQRYATAEEIPTEHARLDDNGDGHGSELQQSYLPSELGGSVRKKEKPKKKEKAEPKPGPKDDGARAATIRVVRIAEEGVNREGRESPR